MSHPKLPKSKWKKLILNPIEKLISQVWTKTRVIIMNITHSRKKNPIKSLVKDTKLKILRADIIMSRTIRVDLERKKGKVSKKNIM